MKLIYGHESYVIWLGKNIREICEGKECVFYNQKRIGE